MQWVELYQDFASLTEKLVTIIQILEIHLTFMPGLESRLNNPLFPIMSKELDAGE